MINPKNKLVAISNQNIDIISSQENYGQDVLNLIQEYIDNESSFNCLDTLLESLIDKYKKYPAIADLLKILFKNIQNIAEQIIFNNPNGNNIFDNSSKKNTYNSNEKNTYNSNEKKDKPFEFVYIFKDNKYYKIGKTNNINNRLKTLRTANINIKFVLSCKTTDAFILEYALHKHFKSKNIDLEWFDLDKEDIQELLNMGFNYALEDKNEY